MITKNIKVILTSITLFTSVLAMPVYADGECTTSYGGSTTCVPTDLTINKQVQNPVTGFYVQNVTSSKFSQGDRVTFKLTVKNTSGETFSDVKITDTVPENLVLIDADVNYLKDGKKDYTISSDKKSIEFRLGNFPASSTAEMYLFTKLTGQYPTDESFCRDNWANVTSAERPNGDKSFARFCVQNKVLGVTTLPKAGVNELAMILPFALTGLGGLALIKKRK